MRLVTFTLAPRGTIQYLRTMSGDKPKPGSNAPTYPVSIRTAIRPSTAPELNTGRFAREYCYITPAYLQTIHRTVGQHVRVSVDGTKETGLFTVRAISNLPTPCVEIGIDTLPEKLNLSLTGGELAGRIIRYAPHPSYSDSLAASKKDFVERIDLHPTARNFLILAPHGGNIEPDTAGQAETVYKALQTANKNPSRWFCLGYRSDECDADDRWHITSTQINATSFPKLSKIAEHSFMHVISFHGFIAANAADKIIYVGGLSNHRNGLRDALVAAFPTLDIPAFADVDSHYQSAQPENITNRLAVNPGGIQIEQSKKVRTDHGTDVANAVADFIKTL